MDEYPVTSGSKTVISSTSAKLRNLKQFLSSSRKSLLHKTHGSPLSPSKSPSHLHNQTSEALGYTYYNDTIGNCSINNKISSSSSHISDNHLMKCHSSGTTSSNNTPSRPPKTISLINLRSSKNRFPAEKQYSKREPLYEQIRPVSTAFDDIDSDNHNDYSQYKSKSMYGLCENTEADEDTSYTTKANSTDSRSYGNIPARNLALRFFQTIRSKFKKRRRDLNNKIVDSKSTSDFGAFQYSNGQEDSALKSSQSVDNVLKSLFGSRSHDETSYADPDETNDDDEPVISSSPQPMTPTNFPCDQDNESDSCFVEEGKDTTESATSTNELVVVTASNSQASPLVNNSGLTADDTTSKVVPSLSMCSISPASPTKPESSHPCLTKELDDLFHHGWYWAGLSKEEAEAKLRGQPDGAFIVRDSTSRHYLLSLSFNSNGRCLHTRIEYRGGQFNFYSNEEDSFPSVAELIEHCIRYSELGVFCYSVKSVCRRGNLPSFPVRLIKPISRFTEVKSLAYLSRFVIRKYVRKDLIPQLPLPQRVIEYVSEQRYI